MIGPDAARYLLAGRGMPVARPFHLRWLWPFICEDDIRKWHWVWLMSWPLLGVLMFLYGYDRTDSWQVGVAASLVLLGLPGVWGPNVVRPVGVDLPSMVVGLAAVVVWDFGLVWLALVLVVFAALGKESMPVWVALWAWHPVFLIGLIAPVVRGLVVKPAMDEVTAHLNLREVHDHPFRSALQFHRGQWRDGWVMVAPWGVGVLALVDVSLPVVCCLVFAYLQLLVATDTVRLLHTAAGVPVALAAVETVPLVWLPLAVVVHIVWWRKPVLI